jgi:HTH-type transcriptional regulator, repressor for puuD
MSESRGRGAPRSHDATEETAPAPRRPEPPSLIIDPRAAGTVERGEGVRTTPFVGRWNSSDATLTTGQTSFEPGTGLALHSHNVEESVLVLEGSARVEIGDTTFELATGQATWVPAGVVHRFVNAGRSPLRIYWVYAGREVTRTIAETGETVEHLSERDRGGQREA